MSHLAGLKPWFLNSLPKACIQHQNCQAVKCKQNQIPDFKKHTLSVCKPYFQPLTMTFPLTTPVHTDSLFPKALWHLGWVPQLTLNDTLSYSHCFDFILFPYISLALELKEIKMMYTLYNSTNLKHGKHNRLVTSFPCILQRSQLSHSR